MSIRGAAYPAKYGVRLHRVACLASARREMILGMEWLDLRLGVAVLRPSCVCGGEMPMLGAEPLIEAQHPWNS